MVSRPDDEGFERPVNLTATISDLLTLKGLNRVVVKETSSESDFSESDSESDSSESDEAEEGEIESTSEDDDDSSGDEHPEHSFTHLSPALDYNSDDIREQEVGHPLNRPVEAQARAISKPLLVITEKRLHSDEIEAYHIKKLHSLLVSKYKVEQIVYY